jgi:PhnB protein
MEAACYLSFDGTCAEAFHFYQQVLGGEITALFRHSDTPMANQVPAEWGPRIMHARLEFPGGVLMGGDSPPGSSAPAGFSVALQVDSVQDAERIFAALAEGGTVRMPIAETFWATRFGMLADRYGVPWMVNHMKAQ